VLASAVGLACSGPRSAESPGIPLGSPGITWAAKNEAQRFGFMASQVHPVMSAVFRSYSDSFAEFTCSNCHGEDMEQIDYRMPNESLYTMPEDRPYDDAIDFDEEIAVFMMTKVTPALQELFNQGEGPPTKATCFSCHPKSE
jgi:cytochrome c553